jgi:hypothetical protein
MYDAPTLPLSKVAPTLLGAKKKRPWCQNGYSPGFCEPRVVAQRMHSNVHAASEGARRDGNEEPPSSSTLTVCNFGLPRLDLGCSGRVRLERTCLSKSESASLPPLPKKGKEHSGRHARTSGAGQVLDMRLFRVGYAGGRSSINIARWIETDT